MLSSNQLSKRASRWTCFIASLHISWESFTDATSFHGLKYISTERKIYQKFVWLICMLASFTCLFILSYYLYFHYMAAPTRTIVRSQHYPSVLIPFPALTVCPPNKISTRKTRVFLRSVLQQYDRGTNTSTDENAILRATTQMNDPTEDNFALDRDMEQLDKILEFGKFETADFIKKTSVECNEWIVKCIWNGKKTSCKELFHRVPTSEGYCCSFNYEGVHLDHYHSTYATGFGIYSGLSIVLGDATSILGPRVNNIRVLIHDSFSFPQNIKTDLLVQQRKETAIGLRIMYNLAEYRLRELAPKTRNCVFRDEYHLSYFRRYTFENCLTECQLKRYYELCGCIPYYLPVIERKVCKPSEMSCITLYSTQVLVQESGNGSSACICPNECDMFMIKTSLSEWKFSLTNDSRFELYQGLSENHTILHTYFAQSRNHLFNRVLALRGLNFTSNIGGLVALFLGSSLVSILELVYFFCYRFCKTYRIIREDAKVLFITELYLRFNKDGIL